jgi:enoyl-CoA hydratase/carnithine racemase
MMQVVESPVQSELVGGVAYVTLSRPEAMNAITIALARALEAAVRESAERAGVIVLRGAGGNFCAGGDRDELERLRALGREATRELFASFHAATAAIAEVPVPVLCAVEGHACAGGFELALAADIVLLSETAKLSDIHTNHGMVPGGGSTQRLPRLVGPQRALALILTGDRLTPAQAVAWGLAYRCYPADAFEAEVEAFAARLAAKDSAALARSKRAIREGLERPLVDGIELELETVLEHLT